MDRQFELLGYSQIWKIQPKPQVVEEIASYALETKFAPDPYYFVVGKNGKLISPQTGRLVEASVEKDSEIGAEEFEALKNIQSWAHRESSGSAFWISPPHPERSTASKIIVSQIANDGGQKILFNRSILFDEVSVDYNYGPLVESLSIHSPQDRDVPTSLEDCRSKPIFTDLSKSQWIDILEKHLHIPDVWQEVRSGKDVLAKEKALKDAASIYEALFGPNYPRGFDDDRVKGAIIKADSLGLFGTNPGSCPPALFLSRQDQTAGDFMAAHSVTYGEGKKYVKNCGACGAKIEREIPKGFRCPHCSGVYEGC